MCIFLFLWHFAVKAGRAALHQAGRSITLSEKRQTCCIRIPTQVSRTWWQTLGLSYSRVTQLRHKLNWDVQTCAYKRAWDETSILRLLPVSKNIKASHFEGNYGRWSAASQLLNDAVAKSRPSHVHTKTRTQSFRFLIKLAGARLSPHVRTRGLSSVYHYLLPSVIMLMWLH